MHAALNHLSLNVTDTEFYKELLAYLGFHTVATYTYGFGMTDGTASIWVFQVHPKYRIRPFHRKAVGLNHIAFRIKNRDAIDRLYQDYLLPRKIPVLYGGPAEHPEYEPGYYAVYFEDPDRIKLEVMYLP